MTNLNLQFSEEPLSRETTGEIAKLYQRVFATPPWNEAYRCPSDECEEQYGQEEVPDQNICKCGTPVIDFYDQEELEKEIQEISQRTGFRIATATAEDQKIAGFWYGWEADLETLNQQKLNLRNPDLNTLREVLDEKMDARWLYLAEFGLDPRQRGRGVGKELYRYGLEQCPSMPTILRTNTASPAYFISKKFGFRTVWKYADESYRVLMAK